MCTCTHTHKHTHIHTHTHKHARRYSCLCICTCTLYFLKAHPHQPLSCCCLVITESRVVTAWLSDLLLGLAHGEPKGSILELMSRSVILSSIYVPYPLATITILINDWGLKMLKWVHIAYHRLEIYSNKPS